MKGKQASCVKRPATGGRKFIRDGGYRRRRGSIVCGIVSKLQDTCTGFRKASANCLERLSISSPVIDKEQITNASYVVDVWEPSERSLRSFEMKPWSSSWTLKNSKVIPSNPVDPFILSLFFNHFWQIDREIVLVLLITAQWAAPFRARPARPLWPCECMEVSGANRTESLKQLLASSIWMESEYGRWGRTAKLELELPIWQLSAAVWPTRVLAAVLSMSLKFQF